MLATRGTKQLHRLIARSCQKHVYLQTSHHPAKLQPRMVAKHSLAGWPRRWFPGWYWSPDWHHLSYRGQEPSRATAGRQVTLGGPSHRAGQAEPFPSSQDAWPPSLPALRQEAGLGQREPFGPPWSLFLLPSLQMSSPASFVGQRGHMKGQDLECPQTTLIRHPQLQEPFCFCLLYD